jgi:hypothetical protein
VETLVDEEKSAGYYQIDFNGSYLPSGMYIYTFITEEFKAVRKMTLVK